MKKMAIVIGMLAALAAGYLYMNPQTTARLLQGTPLAPVPSVTTAYKWRNAKGEWQITDQPPPAGTRYQTIRLRGDQNVMPLVPKREEK